MASILSPQATAIADVIIGGLNNGDIRVESIPSYLGYKDVHDALGISEIRANTWGRSFLAIGGLELARWTKANGYPAITGLVINKEDLMPGGEFFDLFKDRFGVRTQFEWWRQECQEAAEFNWDSVLRPRPQAPEAADTKRVANYALRNRDRLRTFNYIRKADPLARYWFDFAESRLTEYQIANPGGFNLVLAGAPEQETDFFVIPFGQLASVLTDSNLVSDRNGRRRWIGDVRSNRLRITHSKTAIDIGEGYGNLELLEHPDFAASLGSDEDGYHGNDYAGYGRVAEVEQRINQSRFRAAVLANFDGRCCLSELGEPDLLIAGHIIPWSARVACRLDPANGVLLSPLYDRLFDKGYISFDDSLRVIVTKQMPLLSSYLRSVLSQLEGKQARLPSKYAINAEYLAYHRENILRQ